MKAFVVYVQQVVRSLQGTEWTKLETGQAGADARRGVFPQALATQTNKPLDSFDT